ncbi:hypothetical protein, variant [Capsaspora owczarzaki ATCC 30864]|uniref:Uncharacterized protein n=1 Tax=Capsaspora owczarzaki (strain ATCC 30864) TaxID=595528 RepID=A0A0D2UDE9_CAPO3|nr:hypothetical protein, variant [Capsaspora owczarzaki ATCC 30864]
MGKTKGGLPRGSLMDVDELRPASSSARQPASSAGGFGAHASPSSSGGWTGMAVDGQPAGRQPAAQRKNKNGQRGAARGGRNGRGGAQAQHQRQQGRSHAQAQVQQHGHDAGSSSMDLDSPAGVASNDNGYHDSEFMSDAAIGMILSSGAAAGRGAGGFLSAGMGLDDGGAGEDASLTAGNTRDRSNLPEAGDGAQAALELLEEQSMAKKAKQQFAKAQRAGNLMDDGTGMIPFSRARAFPSGERNVLVLALCGLQSLNWKTQFFVVLFLAFRSWT